MRLEVKNGKVRLRSFYRLFVLSWFFGLGTLFGSIFLLTAVLVTLSQLSTNEIYVNGVAQAPTLGTLLFPWVLTLVVPFIVGIHAVLFGAVLTFGVWLYSIFRPDFRRIEIMQEDSVANE